MKLAAKVKLKLGVWHLKAGLQAIGGFIGTWCEKKLSLYFGGRQPENFVWLLQPKRPEERSANQRKPTEKINRFKKNYQID